MITAYTSRPPTDDYGLGFTTLKYDTDLAGTAEQTLTVPGDAKRYKAVFSYEAGASVWVAKGATATTPGAAFAATDSELNPACREVIAGDVLHFITLDTNAEVGVIFYSVGAIN